MRRWETVLCKNATYEQARKLLDKFSSCYITRREWDGVHFLNANKDYCILLKTGEILVNPENIMDTDKNDWMLVTVKISTIREITQQMKLV